MTGYKHIRYYDFDIIGSPYEFDLRKHANDDEAHKTEELNRQAKIFEKDTMILPQKKRLLRLSEKYP